MPLSCQSPTTPVADVPAQRVWTEVRPPAMEPAVLSGSGMPVRSSQVAGCATASEPATGQGRKIPTRRGRAGAPQPSQVGIRSDEAAASCAGAWSRSADFFSGDLCRRPGCFEPPVRSPRNPGCYCCAACRQAVRNAEDRERKWLSRGKLMGRLKRILEYQAARRKRVRGADVGSGSGPPAPP